MLMIINRALDYTKFMKGVRITPQSDSVPLRETVMGTIDVMANLEDRVPIELKPISKYIKNQIITDKQWLKENLLCLISNGVKYSNKGKVTITVSLTTAKLTSPELSLPYQHQANRVPKEISDDIDQSRKEEKEEEPPSTSTTGVFKRTNITVYDTVGANAKFLLFEIEDCGEGISSADVQNLFAPFKQAQRSTGGTGLGLFSLAHRIEAINGAWGVSKRKDRKQGTMFWFAIPYIEDIQIVENEESSRDFISKGPGDIGDELQMLSPTVSADESRRKTASGHDILTPSIVPAKQGSAESSLRSNESVASVELTNFDGFLAKAETVVTEAKPPRPSSSASNAGNNGNGNDTENKPIEIFGADSQEAKERDRPEATKYSVLLVDDSPTIIKLCSLTLKRLNYNVTVAENGQVAVDKVKEKWDTSRKEFDLILMDIQMPVMDGIQATKQIRQLEREWTENMIRNMAGPSPEGLRSPSSETKTPSTRLTSPAPISAKTPNHHLIFGVSANSDNETIEEAYAAGVDEFLSKPFSMEILSTAFKKHMTMMVNSNRTRSISSNNNNHTNISQPPDTVHSVEREEGKSFNAK
jgi:CheY-like chemotaxis protein